MRRRIVKGIILLSSCVMMLNPPHYVSAQGTIVIRDNLNKASNVYYDKSNKSLTSDTVQGAVDELDGKIVGLTDDTGEELARLYNSLASTNEDVIALSDTLLETDNKITKLKTNTKNELDELKKSVSDGKSSLASAITAQGVTTTADATFDIMANNIATACTNKFNAGKNDVTLFSSYGVIDDNSSRAIFTAQKDGVLRYYVFNCTDDDADFCRVYKNGSIIREGVACGESKVNVASGTINFAAGDTISWWTKGDWNRYYKSIMVIVGYYYN